MNHTFFAAALILSTALPTFAAPSNPCSLDRTVLRAYERPNATLDEMAEARRAVSAFMGCDPGDIDESSRKVFFSVVEREFRTDHSSHLATWKQRHTDSDALTDAIALHQHELREYMDRLFDPARDREFRHVVLNYGKAKTIAALGPDAKNDVVKSLRVANHFYGLSQRYNSQIDALAALGYWIDPENASFTPAEKYELTEILTGLLLVSENVQDGNHRRIVQAALSSLAKSDDTHALAAVERWAAKQAGRNDSLSKAAEKTLAQMRKNAKK